MIGRYGEMARREGLVGMAATNTSPLVTPTRGKAPVFGTNPLCVTAPAGIYDAGGGSDSGDADSFVLDMSTSSVAVGKIEMQLRKGEPLPSTGWALGSDSKPTKDAHDAFYGTGGKPFYKKLLLNPGICHHIDLNPLTTLQEKGLFASKLFLGECFLEKRKLMPPPLRKSVSHPLILSSTVTSFTTK